MSSESEILATKLEELRLRMEELKGKHIGKKCKRDGCHGVMIEKCYNYFVCSNNKCYQKQGIKTTNQKTIEKFEKHKRLHEKQIREAVDDYEEALEEYNKLKENEKKFIDPLINDSLVSSVTNNNNTNTNIIKDSKTDNVSIDTSGNVVVDSALSYYSGGYCVIC